MQTLKLLEQIAVIREYTIRLVNGQCSAGDVEDEIFRLAELLTGVSSTKRKSPQQPPEISEEIEDVKHEPSSSRLYMNPNGILLYEIETNKDGIAFQESNGFVIFVPNKDLKFLKPAKTIKDNANLIWTISPTDNEYVVVAENEIGDTIIGMKAVQNLINGTETMEG